MMKVSTWVPAAMLAAAVVMSVACTAQRGGRESSSTPAADQPRAPRLDHIAPARDSMGATPTYFEWTPVAGADHYAIGILNEIDVYVWRRDDIGTTSIDWPAELELEFGTYMWTVTALRGDIPLAESGRSAFVITR